MFNFLRMNYCLGIISEHIGKGGKLKDVPWPVRWRFKVWNIRFAMSNPIMTIKANRFNKLIKKCEKKEKKRKRGAS